MLQWYYNKIYQQGVIGMDKQQQVYASERIFRVIQELQFHTDAWVPLSAVTAPLASAGVHHKAFGFSKLRPFLFQFQELLEFRDEQTGGNPPVCYVRLRAEAASDFRPTLTGIAETKILSESSSPGYPAEDVWLFTWASIPASQIKALSEMALEETWCYGHSQPKDQKEFPVLRYYLANTFKRLCFEHKVRVAVDPVRHEEYAAFNTGLVDKKYEPIYALFRHDTRYHTQYWYLIAFVVAGEDLGKKLVSLFNPLPEKADYFDGKLEHKYYDPSSGALSCGYTHIITERTYRLPPAFLKEHCPPELLCVDGIHMDAVYHAPFDSFKQEYFLKLGKQIRQNPRIFNRLRNQLESAVNFAQKRVRWNYNTAVPMYDPTKNQVFFLLPLSLVEEERVDLALVVERQVSGSYQGQTVLSLGFAYENSRIIAPPNTDWLNTDAIMTNHTNSFDDCAPTLSKAVS